MADLTNESRPEIRPKAVICLMAVSYIYFLHFYRIEKNKTHKQMYIQLTLQQHWG